MEKTLDSILIWEMEWNLWHNKLTQKLVNELDKIMREDLVLVRVLDREVERESKSF